MDVITTVFGGILVSVSGLAIGKYIGGNNKMSDSHCEEKRKACKDLLTEKIDNVADKVDELSELVKEKIIK